MIFTEIINKKKVFEKKAQLYSPLAVKDRMHKSSDRFEVSRPSMESLLQSTNSDSHLCSVVSFLLPNFHFLVPSLLPALHDTIKGILQSDDSDYRQSPLFPGSSETGSDYSPSDNKSLLHGLIQSWKWGEALPTPYFVHIPLPALQVHTQTGSPVLLDSYLYTPSYIPQHNHMECYIAIII